MWLSLTASDGSELIVNANAILFVSARDSGSVITTKIALQGPEKQALRSVSVKEPVTLIRDRLESLSKRARSQ